MLQSTTKILSLHDKFWNAHLQHSQPYSQSNCNIGHPWTVRFISAPLILTLRSVLWVSVFQESFLVILLWPKHDANIPNIFDRFHPWTWDIQISMINFWDRESTIKCHASRAFFPTCLLPCTRRSHGRHSPCLRSHVLRAYCTFASKQAISITLLGPRPNSKRNWTIKHKYCYLVSLSFFIRSLSAREVLGIQK